MPSAGTAMPARTPNADPPWQANCERTPSACTQGMFWMIHGISHGLGLAVHDPAQFSTGDRVYKPGDVFTIEPGLYYPSKGYGVRIEDTYYCTPDGEFESLTPFPKQLVIPLG